MKQLNLNLNKTLSPNSNIVLSSQQAIKSYVDSKKVFVQFLQESAPTTFKAGDKWINTASNKLFIATNDTTWDSGSNLDTTAIYSFGNLLYHYNGVDTKCYSTTSITEQNANKEIKEWFGTQDEYSAIETKDENTHYIIIDDTSTSSSLLATQEEFNNSVTDKAATPKQVNEKIGNYLPLAGGNLDKGAILRFTNTNNQVSSVSLDENKYITMSDNLKVSGDINTNSLVSTTGNIYKGNSSGATNIRSDSFATTEKAGIIKVGNNLTVAEDGTLNAEADGGSGFDFEGTKAEFDAAVAAGIITDDSVSMITDDVSGDTVATKTELDMISSEKANIDLSNTDMLTNCILSAPNGVFKTPNWKEFWNGSDVTLFATDRNNVKLSVSGAYTKDKVSLTDANGNWSYVAKFKITKNDAGSTVTARGRILYFGFKNADASQSAYTEIQLSDSSGASELKPFFARIRPKFGDTTTEYEIQSTQKPVVDAWNWIKLQKNGTVYTMFYSTDGNSWTSLGQVQAENFSGVPEEISGGFRITRPTNADLNMYADFSTDTLNFFYNSLTSTPLVTYDEYTLTVNKGLKVALANGYNADGTPKSEIVTFENDISFTAPSTAGYNWPISIILLQYSTDGYRVVVPSKNDFSIVKEIPSNIPTDFYKVYYCTNTNTFYEHRVDGILEEYKGVLLGSGVFVDSKFTNIVPYKPIQLSLEGLGDYVVESQVNSDGSWYRKYKSGWLEQGGVFSSTGNITYTITFLKPFINTKYTALLTSGYSTVTESGVDYVKTKTTTNMIVIMDNVSGFDHNWEAKGMGAN